jgi:hypothetical protein
MCSVQAFVRSEQRADIRQARMHMGLVAEALAKADRAGRPVLFLQFVREAIPWSSGLSEHELDVFLGEFLAADWRQEREAAAIVAKWIAHVRQRSG